MKKDNVKLPLLNKEAPKTEDQMELIDAVSHLASQNHQ